MDQQPHQPVLEVDVVADDTRVRRALAALVNATPGFVVGCRLDATEASSDPEGADRRIVVLDLDSTPSTLFDQLTARGGPLVALGNAPFPANPAVIFVDKGAPTDAIADALRLAADYVICRTHNPANVCSRSRRATDAEERPQGGRLGPR